MSETAKTNPEGAGDVGEELQLDPYKVEPARSSRSRCRTCRKKIEKGDLRIGVLLEGPYGTGYLWHHLKCAARRRLDDVEAAYEAGAWEEGLEVPPIEELRELAEKAEKAKAEKKELPHAERAPSGRAKCKHCDERIEKGAWRVVLGRSTEFYGQVRTAPINVHPRCVAAELRAEDCATEPETLEQDLRANSRGVGADEIEEVLTAIGDV